MEITREQVAARLEKLTSEKAQLQSSIAQIQANINAYDGAIQDCEFWLAELEKEESTKEDK